MQRECCRVLPGPPFFCSCSHKGCPIMLRIRPRPTTPSSSSPRSAARGDAQKGDPSAAKEGPYSPVRWAAAAGASSTASPSQGCWHRGPGKLFEVRAHRINSRCSRGAVCRPAADPVVPRFPLQLRRGPLLMFAATRRAAWASCALRACVRFIVARVCVIATAPSAYDRGVQPSGATRSGKWSGHTRRHSSSSVCVCADS